MTRRPPARPRTPAFRLPSAWARPGLPLRLEALEDRTTPAGGSVFGSVFLDLDGDGTRDFGSDPGVEGLTVFLDDGDGVLEAGEISATTASGGSYSLFTTVSGTYDVAVVPTADYAGPATPPAVVLDDTFLTADVATSLLSGGVVTGTVYGDTNGNGTQDPFEFGLSDPGTTVYADLDGDDQFDAGEPTAAPSFDGTYALALPEDANRTIRVAHPNPAFALTSTPPTPLALAGGATVGDIDFGFRRLGGTVSVSFFSDVNGNLARDTGEPGATAARVFADLDGDGAFDAGEPNVVPSAGSTFATLDVPTNGTFSLRAVAAAGSAISSPQPVSVTLTNGTSTSREFGFRLTTGGYVRGALYYDVNEDGQRQAGEPTLSGSNLGTVSAGSASVSVGGDGTFTLPIPAADGAYDVTLSVGFGQPLTVTSAQPVSVAVAGGALVAGVEFGVTATAGGLVTGSVFLDADGDGTQDAGEGPPPADSFFAYDDANGNGVFDAFGFPAEAGVRVAADGTYAFTRFTDGPATVRLTDRQGSVGFSSRVFVPTTANPAPFLLEGGNAVAVAAFGARFVTGIQGTAFDDVNANGFRDFNPATGLLEPAFAGLTVYADLDGDGVMDPAEPAAVTDAAGGYLLDVGAAGGYRVRAVVPAGRFVTTSSNFDTTVLTEQVAFGPTFGLYAVAGTIAGTVFLDGNLTGAADPGEGGTFVSSGIGVFAELAPGNGQADPGEPVATVDSTTGAFTLLIPAAAPGSYVVRVAAATGVVPLAASAAVAVSGGSATTLAAPVGYTRTGGRVSGSVFVDRNANGIQDGAEQFGGGIPAGVSGRVYADLNGNAQFDAGEPTAAVGGSTFYSLTLPADGAYTIRFDLASGFALTTPAAVEVLLEQGAFVNLGMGVRQSAGGVIEGTLFYDTDGDGTRDAGEPGLPAGGAAPVPYLDLNQNGVLDFGTDVQGSTFGDGAFTLATPAADGTYQVRLSTTGLPGAATTADPVLVAVSGGGTAATTAALGYRAPAGGVVLVTVFGDANGNGTQDAGEAGAGAASVTVYDDADDDGVLDFDETSTQVGTGTVYALVVAADGAVRPRVAVSSFGGGTATVTTPTPGLVAVAGGAVVTGPAIGVRVPTLLSGLVFEDRNGNGSLDSNPADPAATEPGLAGVTVYADLDADGGLDAGEPAAVSNSFGGYTLDLPGAGTYTVRAVPDGGRVRTGADPVVTAGGVFGPSAPAIGLLAVAGTVTGSVFLDANGNGTRDGGEGAANESVGVRAYADLNGNAALDAGEPAAVVSAAGTYTLLIPAAAANPVTVRVTGFAAVQLTTAAPSVTVAGGAAVPAAEVGYRPVGGSVSVAVFNDANGNGAFDPTDPTVSAPGLTAVTAFADLDGDGALDPGEPTTTSSSFGTVLVLPANGTYTVRLVVPAGFAASGPATATVAVADGASQGVALGLRLAAGGYVPGTLYYDANGNGAKDAGEVGFAGPAVYVDANGDGSPGIGEVTVTPDAAGAFLLASPPVDGSYLVRASGAALTTAVTPVRSPLAGGGTAAPVAVGVRAATGGLVRGAIFLDADGDGVQDPGEGAVPAGSLFAYDDVDGDGGRDFDEPGGTVAADGSFAFLAAGDGAHRVRVTDAPFGSGSGSRAFDQTTADPAAFPLAGGAVQAGLVFGGRLLTAVRGTVFDDANGNGVRDRDPVTFVPSEPGLAGATVYADLDGDGTPDAGEPAALTDADGFYELVLAAGGTVTVRAALAGRVPSTAPAATPVETGFVAVAGELGLRPAAGSISGTVFSDLNGDGDRDAGEPGVAGLVVFADADGNGTRDAGEPAATTAADGSYTIAVTAAGTYTPRLEGTAGGTLTTPPPAAVPVAGGATVPGADFGLFYQDALVSVAAASVAEGDAGTRDLVFTVTRSGNTTTAVDVTVSTGGGTAVAGTDYTAAAGTVAFAAGQTAAEVRVPVLGNARFQADRTLTLTLTAGAGVTLGTAAATGTITDDDAPATVTAVAGTTPQSAAVGAAFATVLAVDVRNAAGTLVEGVTVTFAAPGTGAGATFGGSPVVVTGPAGRAVAPPLTATGTAGAYAATATATGGTGPQAAFALSNTAVAPPNTAPTVALGAAPPAVPPGVVPAAVAVTVGDAESAPGALVVTVAPPAAGALPYTVTGTGATRTITFTGNAAAAGSTTTFTVTVSDGLLSRTATFAVTVRPAPVSRPPVQPEFVRPVAVGSDVGGGTVTLYHPDGSVAFRVTPFPDAAGGVRTATADFNGDGTADVVAGTGPGSPARVVILDTVTGQPLFSTPVFEGFPGGVFVAAGDLDGDGRPELIVTPDEGGGPRVLVFAGDGFAPVASFFGIDDPAFRGGARAAVGDINRDGVPDLVVAAGFGGGPRVAAYDGAAAARGRFEKLFADFFAFEPELRNGAYLAVGDVDGDGFGDLIAGAGPGGGPRVLALSGEDLLAGRGNQARVLANFFGGDPANRNGVRVAVKDLDGDRRADLVVAPGTGTAGRVVAYLGKDLGPDGLPPEFGGFADLPGVTGGAYVG